MPASGCNWRSINCGRLSHEMFQSPAVAAARQSTASPGARAPPNPPAVCRWVATHPTPAPRASPASVPSRDSPPARATAKSPSPGAARGGCCGVRPAGRRRSNPRRGGRVARAAWRSVPPPPAPASRAAPPAPRAAAARIDPPPRTASASTPPTTPARRAAPRHLHAAAVGTEVAEGIGRSVPERVYRAHQISLFRTAPVVSTAPAPPPGRRARTNTNTSYSTGETPLSAAPRARRAER